MIIDTTSAYCTAGEHQSCPLRWLISRWDPKKEGLSHAHGPRENVRGYCICPCHTEPPAPREPGEDADA